MTQLSLTASNQFNQGVGGTLNSGLLESTNCIPWYQTSVSYPAYPFQIRQIANGFIVNLTYSYYGKFNAGEYAFKDAKEVAEFIESVLKEVTPK